MCHDELPRCASGTPVGPAYGRAPRLCFVSETHLGAAVKTGPQLAVMSSVTDDSTAAILPSLVPTPTGRGSYEPPSALPPTSAISQRHEEAGQGDLLTTRGCQVNLPPTAHDQEQDRAKCRRRLPLQMARHDHSKESEAAPHEPRHPVGTYGHHVSQTVPSSL